MVTGTFHRSKARGAVSLPLRAPSLAVLNVASVRSLHAHTAPPSHTESIESAQVLSSMVPCWHSGSTRASPFVSHDCDLFRVPFRSRAQPPTSTPPSSPPPRASLPRDCPILRPRAVGCLSRAEGMRLSVRDELRSHTPHAIPLILPACCGLLHACVETLQAPFELAAARGPISPCCRIHTRLLFAG